MSVVQYTLVLPVTANTLGIYAFGNLQESSDVPKMIEASGSVADKKGE